MTTLYQPRPQDAQPAPHGISDEEYERRADEVRAAERVYLARVAQLNDGQIYN